MLSSWTRRLLGISVVFAALVAETPIFAQTGGVTGKCLGEDGKALAGYTIQLERTEIKWQSHVKTNKKGEYTYIGLAPGTYKLTLVDPSGRTVFNITKHVGIGDPTEIDFDMAKERAVAQKDQAANPEYQKKVAEDAKEQKQFTGLKQTFDQGQALYQAQKYKEAAAMFEQALPLAKEKNVPIVLSQLAQSYSRAAPQEGSPDDRKADYQKAQQYYQKALELNPSSADLHNNLGSLYADMGDVENAQKEFQKAAELNPTGAGTYYYNLGVVLVNKGKMDDAANALKKATEADPKNSNAFYWLGMALLGKAEYKPDGSIVPVPGTVEAFQKYLELDPKGQWAEAAQASIQQLSGKVPTEFKAAKKKKG
ncbi:MAG: tetratricopeptide repeat protein [Acidobacteriia bacterium]|nr:tetratricopeptide repeat protein [Terriglobia bacterium]